MGRNVVYLAAGVAVKGMLVAIMAMGLWMAGCGYKGDLHLPDDPRYTRSRPVPPPSP